MYLTVRRVVDVLVVIVSLPFWAVLLACAVLAVRISMGTPVFFKQKRTGLAGKTFTIFKLRTMKSGSENDADRLTGTGRFLRRTSLDELPQVFNVLRGEMSIVGPRPLLPEYLSRYSPEQARRHEITPGITGWAQVNGRNAISWEDKFRFDVWYVDHVSPLVDIKILFLTAVSVFSGRGITSRGEVTAAPFMGTGSRHK